MAAEYKTNSKATQGEYMKLTIKSVREELRKHGITLRSIDGELIVSRKGAKLKDTFNDTYFTHNLADARKTGLTMAGFKEPSNSVCNCGEGSDLELGHCQGCPVRDEQDTPVVTWRLIGKSGRELKAGDKVETASGEVYILAGFRAPKHEGSTGRVDLKAVTGEYVGEYYPSVIDAHIARHEVSAVKHPDLHTVMYRTYATQEEAELNAADVRKNGSSCVTKPNPDQSNLYARWGIFVKPLAMAEVVEFAQKRAEPELQWIDKPHVQLYRFETANRDLLMVAPMLVAAEALGFEREAAHRLVKECEQDGCSALFFTASRPSKMFGMRSVNVRKEVR